MYPQWWHACTPPTMNNDVLHGPAAQCNQPFPCTSTAIDDRTNTVAADNCQHSIIQKRKQCEAVEIGCSWNTTNLAAGLSEFLQSSRDWRREDNSCCDGIDEGSSDSSGSDGAWVSIKPPAIGFARANKCRLASQPVRMGEPLPTRSSLTAKL